MLEGPAFAHTDKVQSVHAHNSSLQMVDLLDFVPIVGHVGRPADVVVLPDDRYVLDQIQPGAEQPLVALGPLGVAYVLIEPALHEGVKAVVHGFRDGGMCLSRLQQRLALVEDVMLVQHEANLVVVHAQSELFPIVNVVALVAVTARKPFGRLTRLAFVVPSGRCRHLRGVSLLQSVVVIIVGSDSFRGLLLLLLRSYVVQLLTGGGSCRRRSSSGQRRFAIAIVLWRGICFEFWNLRRIGRLTATQIAL